MNQRMLAYLLLLALASQVGCTWESKVVYFDSENGVMDSSCWRGETETPCGSLELAQEGARSLNFTVVVIEHEECEYDNTAAGFEERNAFEDGDCPPWFIPQNNSCECGSDVGGIIYCNNTLQMAAVLGCHCVTYANSTGVVAGSCLYNCEISVHHSPLPYSNYQLNEVMCHSFNRDGQLCGQCRPGYHPPVYSYELQCVKCSGSQLGNWLYYIVVAILPVTVFFILAIFFRISAATPQLNAFVFVSQVMGSPMIVRAILSSLRGKEVAIAAVRSVSVFYGIWSLDFFRSILPHICLEVTTLQAVAIEYIIAFYPLSLTMVTYFLAVLHSHNFRPVVWVWKPFHQCFARFRRQWTIQDSAMDAFATFLLLSYARLLGISFELLVPVPIYNVYGNTAGYYLHYDTSIEYFGSKHLPYACLALVVLLLLVIAPLVLLLLYPLKCFQKYIRQCRVLFEFISAFNGNFKDGSDGSKDCRCFAVVYLVVRILLLLAYGVTFSGLYFAISTMVLIVLAILVAVVKPYKQRYATYNTVDVVLILSMTLWHISILCVLVSVTKAFKYIVPTMVLSFVVALLPLVYLLALIVHWFYCRRFLFHNIFGRNRLLRWIRMRRMANEPDDLPDRLLHPEGYEDSIDEDGIETELHSPPMSPDNTY